MSRTNGHAEIQMTFSLQRRISSWGARDKKSPERSLKDVYGQSHTNLLLFFRNMSFRRDYRAMLGKLQSTYFVGSFLMGKLYRQKDAEEEHTRVTSSSFRGRLSREQTSSRLLVFANQEGIQQHQHLDTRQKPLAVGQHQTSGDKADSGTGLPLRAAYPGSMVPASTPNDPIAAPSLLEHVILFQSSVHDDPITRSFSGQRTNRMNLFHREHDDQLQ